MASAANIDFFLDVTQCASREVAVNYLNYHGDNAEDAMRDWFDNGADTHRHSGYLTVTGPSSQMESLPPMWTQRDAKNGGMFQGPAPSRPPSRSNNWGELAFGEQETGVVQGPMNQDDDLQRAIEDSLKETLNDPQNPHDRERHAGPAFLRPLPGNTPNEFLPSFISILSSIPACRLELLALGDVLPDYGHERNWWRGEKVEMSRITFDGEVVSPAAVDLEVIHETQRLMIFLHTTQRAYGSAEALTKVAEVVQDAEYDEWTDVSPFMIKFMREWETAAVTGNVQRSLDSLFRSETGTGDYVPPHDSVLILPSLPSLPGNLYNSLDQIMWGDDYDKRPALWVEPAPILSVIASPAPDKPLEIPTVLQVDRYLEENRNRIETIRHHSRGEEEALQRIEAKVANLTQYQEQKSTGIVNSDATLLLKTAIKHLQDTVEFMTPSATPRNESEMDVDDPTDSSSNAERHKRAQDLLSGLRSFSTTVEARVQDLQSEATTHSTRLQELKGLSNFPALHPAYHLRGVAILPSPISSHTYVLHPNSAGHEEWWRLSFEASSGSTARASSAVVSEADVLAAASVRRHETLLVYTREDAITPRVDVEMDVSAESSAPLALFAAKERQLFEIECSEWDNSLGTNANWDPSLPVIEGRSPRFGAADESASWDDISYEWEQVRMGGEANLPAPAKGDDEPEPWPAFEDDGTGAVQGRGGDGDEVMAGSTDSMETLVAGLSAKRKSESEGVSGAVDLGSASPGKRTRVEFDEGDDLGYGAG